jgi:hypothetical protein
VSSYVLWQLREDARRKRKNLIRNTIVEYALVIAIGVLLGHAIRIYVG